MSKSSLSLPAVVAAAKAPACGAACRGSSRAQLKTSLLLRAGDPVDVRLPHHYVLLGAVFLHGLPMAAMLLGGLAGVAATGSDAGCLAGAVLGVALSSLAARPLRWRVEAATLRALRVERQRAHAHTHSL